jgi:kumamolisin
MLRISLEKSRVFRLGLASAITASTLVVGVMDASRAASLAPDAPALVATVPRVQTHDLGRLAATTRIRIDVALNYRFASDLEALIEATSDPRSPQYGQFLSPRQFEAAFAPTTADY